MDKRPKYYHTAQCAYCIKNNNYDKMHMEVQRIRSNENYINALIGFDRNLNMFCIADK